MRNVYVALAFLIGLLAVLQSGVIEWGDYGLDYWISEKGGVLSQEIYDAAYPDEGEAKGLGFAGESGYVLGYLNGSFLSPLVALLLLAVSPFARVPGGWARAAVLLALVVVQDWVLSPLGESVNPGFGFLHGVNLFLIVGVALWAGLRARRAARASSPVAPPLEVALTR